MNCYDTIARSILNNPKVIIADEPTGNLDIETARQIILLLRRITESGTAVVMTTHNTSLIQEYPGIVYRCINQRLEDITNDYNHMVLIFSLLCVLSGTLGATGWKEGFPGTISKVSEDYK